jgi:hypothetical protein
MPKYIEKLSKVQVSPFEEMTQEQSCFKPLFEPQTCQSSGCDPVTEKPFDVLFRGSDRRDFRIGREEEMRPRRPEEGAINCGAMRVSDSVNVVAGRAEEFECCAADVVAGAEGKAPDAIAQRPWTAPEATLEVFRAHLREAGGCEEIARVEEVVEDDRGVVQGRGPCPRVAGRRYERAADEKRREAEIRALLSDAVEIEWVGDEVGVNFDKVGTKWLREEPLHPGKGDSIRHHDTTF